MENFKAPICDNQELDHWLCKVKIRTLKKIKKLAHGFTHPRNYTKRK